MLRYGGVDTKKGGRGRLYAGGKTVQQGGRQLQNKVRTSIAKVLGRAAVLEQAAVRRQAGWWSGKRRVPEQLTQ
jgi:hypothetical protein